MARRWRTRGGEVPATPSTCTHGVLIIIASMAYSPGRCPQVEQIAAATATSHVRASVGKAPAHFKEVIDAALGTSYARMTWADSVARVAKEYREQVLLDYECFFAYANETAGPL